MISHPLIDHTTGEQYPRIRCVRCGLVIERHPRADRVALPRCIRCRRGKLTVAERQMPLPFKLTEPPKYE